MHFSQLPARLQDLYKHSSNIECNHENADGWEDYIANFELTLADGHSLLELATWEASDEELDAAGIDDMAIVEGPAHAWRALGQLGVIDAIAPLARYVEGDGSDLWDEWANEEMPVVFGIMGEAAIEPLRRHIEDVSIGERGRISLVEGLEKVAQFQPPLCDRVTSQLDELLQLEIKAKRYDDIATFLVISLVELKAKTAAETIERAFAAQLIDETLGGCWGDTRRALDVEGMGLAADRRFNIDLMPERRRDRMEAMAIENDYRIAPSPKVKKDRSKALKKLQGKKKKK
ncbi:hypothetical protein [Blastopirellula marina]|uniref:Uncharacterized protein n=1 Tax=Blastopirellula marina DSM 3645 TaxID=314230 RepID=A3ZXP9_9BACT|nr:hypothetical protein [Blastopirellula marina]EAQ78606.1 hypothetical protein DSM3645_07435 [Blastopirellula marina DSM 3645]